MATNAIFFGWMRSVPGREMVSAEHFGQFLGYLEQQKGAGTITSFDTVFLNPHASDLAGFFLIQGKTDKLHALVETPEWIEHITRASLHLENTRVVLGSAGAEVMNLMQVWTKSIPKS